MGKRGPAPTRPEGITAQGYRRIWMPDHPLADRTGMVLQHRQVAWDSGILTDPSDSVHHRNGDKLDNRPENLEALSSSAHAEHHSSESVSNQHGHDWPVTGRTRRYRQPKPDRVCALDECPQPIPPSMRRDAIYCSPGHRSTAAVRRLRERRRA